MKWGFFALRKETEPFMKVTSRAIPNFFFICNIAFQTDITDHLNALRMKLQGRKQVIAQIHDSGKSF